MPKAGSTTVVIARKHYKRLAIASKQTGIPMSDLLSEALADYTDNVLPTTVEAALRMRKPRLVAV